MLKRALAPLRVQALHGFGAAHQRVRQGGEGVPEPSIVTRALTMRGAAVRFVGRPPRLLRVNRVHGEGGHAVVLRRRRRALRVGVPGRAVAVVVGDLALRGGLRVRGRPLGRGPQHRRRLTRVLARRQVLGVAMAALVEQLLRHRGASRGCPATAVVVRRPLGGALRRPLGGQLLRSLVPRGSGLVRVSRRRRRGLVRVGLGGADRPGRVSHIISAAAHPSRRIGAAAAAARGVAQRAEAGGERLRQLVEGAGEECL
mmetsp:Transcript_35546/g.94181  ORF Transcript_35546/g.94181 Transcript_35546/m.94181 type:complete len:257 (+) Transcript_35546:339-1109(+)